MMAPKHRLSNATEVTTASIDPESEEANGSQLMAAGRSFQRSGQRACSR
jgi:hypothetical protein